MTAVGFLLSFIAFVGANVLGARYGLNKWDYFFVCVALAGFGLLAGGVTAWLWEVMP